MSGTLGWLRAWIAQTGHGENGQAGESFGAFWNEFMIEEVSDSRVWHVPFTGWEVHLPQWPPLHVGPLTIDLSPTKHVVALVLAATVCAIVMIWTARKTRARREGRAPTGLANLIEAFIIYLRDEVAMRGIGKGGERYVPFVLTLFFFILFMNLMGLVPFGSTATGNIAVTAALAFLALVVIEVGGFMALGAKGYLKTIFVVPEGLPLVGKIVMAIIMAPVEILAKLARIFALAIRLFANMTAGHIVIFALIGLIFLAGAEASGAGRWVGAVAPALMAAGVMVLEILIALLQAYIFTILTAVFIGLVRHAH
jgi:F-type H+-transporting ATPase subunit a